MRMQGEVELSGRSLWYSEGVWSEQPTTLPGRSMNWPLIQGADVVNYFLLFTITTIYYLLFIIFYYLLLTPIKYLLFINYLPFTIASFSLIIPLFTIRSLLIITTICYLSLLTTYLFSSVIYWRYHGIYNLPTSILYVHCHFIYTLHPFLKAFCESVNTSSHLAIIKRLLIYRRHLLLALLYFIFKEVYFPFVYLNVLSVLTNSAGGYGVYDPLI